MSNWFKHGKTSLCVGFMQQGNICEGGNCDHLNEGDQGFGYSSENDSFGSEYYLMCEPCYNEYLEEVRTGAVVCNDCQAEVPRNTAVSHIPYFVDEEPRAKWQKYICAECQGKGPHLRRLERDAEDRARDQDDQDDRDDQDECDDEPVKSKWYDREYLQDALRKSHVVTKPTPQLKYPVFHNAPVMVITHRDFSDKPGIKSIVVKRKLK